MTTAFSKRIVATVHTWLPTARVFLRRHFSWSITLLLVVATVWLLTLWVHLFRTPLLTDAERDAVRAQYARTTLNTADFDAVITQVRTRERLFAAPLPPLRRDLFFSATYAPPQKERLR